MVYCDPYMIVFARSQIQAQVEDENKSRMRVFPPKSSLECMKLLKGAKLSDAVKLFFNSWQSDMRNVLECNKDHYGTPEARITFVWSMCEGKVAGYLLPCVRDISSNPFVDSEDMFEYLKIALLNVDSIHHAKQEN